MAHDLSVPAMRLPGIVCDRDYHWRPSCDLTMRLQRTRRERRGCHRCVPCAGSLSFYLVVLLVYAMSFGPATYLATKTGFPLRASSLKIAVFDFVFYPHCLLAERWPAYMRYAGSWESSAK